MHYFTDRDAKGADLRLLHSSANLVKDVASEGRAEEGVVGEVSLELNYCVHVWIGSGLLRLGPNILDRERLARW